MSEKSSLIGALTEFVQQQANVNNSIVCKVKTGTIDLTKKVCDCVPINGDATIQNVRLIADSTKDGFILYPKAESIVVVSFIGNNTGFISMVSQIDEIHLAGVNYGGLVKGADLKTRLNNIETKVNQLITAMAAWTVVPNDGGAALKTIAATFYGSSLTATTEGMIESTVVYHGDAT